MSRTKAKKKDDRSFMPEDFRTRYQPYAIKREDGSLFRSKDNGDKIAVALRGMTLAELKAVAKENGVSEQTNALIKSGKSLGQVRMALGLRLRGFVRSKIEVSVNGKQIKSL